MFCALFITIFLIRNSIDAAIGIIGPQKKPLRYLYEQGCYLEMEDEMITFNSTYLPKASSFCVKYFCDYDEHIYITECTQSFDGDCTVVRGNRSLPYPYCCDYCSPSRKSTPSRTGNYSPNTTSKMIDTAFSSHRVHLPEALNSATQIANSVTEANVASTTKNDSKSNKTVKLPKESEKSSRTARTGSTNFKNPAVNISLTQTIYKKSNTSNNVRNLVEGNAKSKIFPKERVELDVIPEIKPPNFKTKNHKKANTTDNNKSNVTQTVENTNRKIKVEKMTKVSTKSNKIPEAESLNSTMQINKQDVLAENSATVKRRSSNNGESNKNHLNINAKPDRDSKPESLSSTVQTLKLNTGTVRTKDAKQNSEINETEKTKSDRNDQNVQKLNNTRTLANFDRKFVNRPIYQNTKASKSSDIGIYNNTTMVSKKKVPDNKITIPALTTEKETAKKSTGKATTKSDKNSKSVPPIRKK